jgi:hypothetical protein
MAFIKPVLEKKEPEFLSKNSGSFLDLNFRHNNS